MAVSGRCTTLAQLLRVRFFQLPIDRDVLAAVDGVNGVDSAYILLILCTGIVPFQPTSLFLYVPKIGHVAFSQKRGNLLLESPFDTLHALALIVIPEDEIQVRVV